VFARKTIARILRYSSDAEETRRRCRVSGCACSAYSAGAGAGILAGQSCARAAAARPPQLDPDCRFGLSPQRSPGIETIDTHAPPALVLRVVLTGIENSEHLRPDIYTDAELPFVTDQDAPGISQFRVNLADMLRAYPVQSQAHGKLIDRVDQDSHMFQVLVLKTNSTLPYSSVFIHLKAKYWSDEAESRLRTKMGSGTQP
jgi:hypothetical protein